MYHSRFNKKRPLAYCKYFVAAWYHIRVRSGRLVGSEPQTGAGLSATLVVTSDVLTAWNTLKVFECIVYLHLIIYANQWYEGR